MKCIICSDRKATIADYRDNPWGKKKKVCAECHSELLRTNPQVILNYRKKFVEDINHT